MSDLDWTQEKIANLQAVLKAQKIKNYAPVLRRIRQRLEDLLSKGETTCSTVEKYDASLLDVELLQKQVEERFYDPEVMHTTLCIAQNIVHLAGYIERTNKIHLFLHNLRRIGAESVYGMALAASLKDAEDFLVLKVPKNFADNQVSRHELALGLYATNPLRAKIPNFVYVYGGFDCSAPLFDKSDVISWCAADAKDRYQYVMYENVANSVTFNDYIRRGCTSTEFIKNYLQVLFALDLARKEIGFTHYDLHSDNVLIRMLPEERSLPYQLSGSRAYVNGDTIATIIDYGMARFEYNKVVYGSPSAVDLEEFFVSTEKTNLYYDAYKLMMFCANTARYYKNEAVLNVCEKIFRFFNKSDAFDAALNPRTYFCYPYVDENKYSLAQLIDFVLTIENPLTSTPLYPQFVCQNTCYNAKQLFNDIEVSKPDTLDELVYQIEKLKRKPILSKSDIRNYLGNHYEMLKGYSGDIRYLLKFILRSSFALIKTKIQLKELENKMNSWGRIKVTFIDYYKSTSNLRAFILYINDDMEVLTREYEKFYNNYESLHKKLVVHKIVLDEDYTILQNTMKELLAVPETEAPPPPRPEDVSKTELLRVSEKLTRILNL